MFLGECPRKWERPERPLEQPSGADAQNRTADLLITNQLLYHLSYIGIQSLFPLGTRKYTTIGFHYQCHHCIATILKFAYKK